METLDVKIISRGKEKKGEETSLKTSLQEKAKEMEEIRKPFILELERKRKELKRIEECKCMFSGLGTVPLRDLKQGNYTVLTAKKQETRFGKQYKLLIRDGDSTYVQGVPIKPHDKEF